MKKVILPGILLALVLGFPAAAAPAPGAASAFTLEQALSFPYPVELKASRSGSRVAWIADRRGIRNIWAAEGPGWKTHPVTDYKADDGQELTQLAFSEDGRTLIYVRGGAHDANWPSPGGVEPNPALSAEKPEVQIFSVPFGGGKPTLLSDGDNPAISPRGDRVAFVKQHQAWTVPLAGGKAVPFFFCRGEIGSLTWSPDGKSLAFVSDRGDHSLVGLYTSAGEPIRFLSPSSSIDSNPVWSPDGARIAFVRQPGKGGAPETLLDLHPEPWSIWTAEVASGKTHAVWRSPDTLAGSIPETDQGVGLTWAAGGRLVFLAELDGWPHLYSIAETGGEPLLLTPGNFMVDAIAITPDRKQILYTANTGNDPDDDDRRHLFRVQVDLPGPVALTSGAEVVWAPVACGDGTNVVFVSSGTATPPLPAVLPLGGGERKRLGEEQVPSDFPAGDFVVPKKIVFRSEDGWLVHGQLFERPGNAEKKPALLFVHGGPPRQMLLGWHYMDYYSNAYAMNQYLASRGYVAMTVNYRLGVGYGRAFQHPEHWGPTGAAEYRDVLAAGRYLASLPEVDARRVGIWGGSYGGYLAALALGRNSDVFAAGVDWHGVHNFLTSGADFEGGGFYRNAQLRYEKADLKEALDVAWQSSPVSAVATWKSPVLLIHGDDDRNVEFHQTADLVMRLKKAGVRFDEVVLPDEIHGFLRFASWIEVESATAEFFGREFRPGR